jgi:hypothetical protein
MGYPGGNVPYLNVDYPLVGPAYCGPPIPDGADMYGNRFMP